MNLTSEQVYGFATTLLSRRFDNAVPTPEFHRELWELCCNPHPRVAIAAPRGHAKSTAVTHAFVLACVLFRIKRYVIIISDTEDQACEFLGDIKTELTENEDLVEMFQVRDLTKNAVTEIIVEMKDGYRFRIVAKGAEQKIRGRKWGGSRPDLIVCDDLENEELTENPDRREKFRKWFMNAVLPSMSDRGHIRVVGTILHLDSLLERLLNNKAWLTRRYSAHKSFDDFSDILWPDKFNEERLRQVRQVYIEEGIPEGYSQEYLNNPIDQTEGFFRRPDFLPREDRHRKMALTYYIGMDFAISDADRADFTVITVGGMDSSGNLHVVDVRRGRWDTYEIVEEMFSVYDRYKPEMFVAEQGAIQKAIWPVLEKEMLKRNKVFHVETMIPAKDKRTRARPIQARMRAGGVYFEKDSEWYPAFEEELIQFPKGPRKDQVDSFAYIGLGLNLLIEAPTEEEIAEEEYEEFVSLFAPEGLNEYTGY